MKKIFLILGILFTITNCAMASDSCSYYDCPTKYDMNTKFRTVVGATFGVNAISERALEHAIENSLTKNSIMQNPKVNIESYSSKDLKNGIFKSGSLIGQNANINDIYFSKVKLNTLCDFNYIKYYTDKNISFVEDLPLSFEVEMNTDDINRTMQHPKYLKLISDINKATTVNGIGLKIKSTKALIKNGKFYYFITFAIPFIQKTKTLTVQSDLKLRNGQINLDNTSLATKDFQIDLSQLKLLVDYLNPFDFSVNIFNNKDAHVNIMNSKISSDSIKINGMVVVPKD